MMHVKLFEEWKVGQLDSFTEKYDNIKPLPPSASCNVENVDQLNAIVNILEQREYRNDNMSEMLVKPDHIASISWSTMEDGWFAYGHKQKENLYCLYESDITEDEEYMFDSLIFFHEYFKFKPKFRGHNLKKFGV